MQIIIHHETYFLQEKGQLQNKLQECEQRLRLLELTDTTDATVVKKYVKTLCGYIKQNIPTQGPLTSLFSELLTVSSSLQ